MSIEGWMDKDVVHIYNGILLSHKKNKIMPFAATWMDRDCPTEWSKSDRKRQNILWYHLYVESKKMRQNELTYKSEINSQTQKKNLWLPKGKGVGGINWEFWINRYTLLYIKQVNNKDLLHSTGNYNQYLVITYNVINYIYIYVYIYIYIYKQNHLAVHLKHCKSTILQ